MSSGLEASIIGLLTSLAGGVSALAARHGYQRWRWSNGQDRRRVGRDEPSTEYQRKSLDALSRMDGHLASISRTNRQMFRMLRVMAERQGIDTALVFEEQD